MARGTNGNLGQLFGAGVLVHLGIGDEQRFELETEAGARALVSREVLEGLASFAQKRDPRW